MPRPRMSVAAADGLRKGVTTLEFHQTVHAPAALEGVPMAMDVFRCELDREPVAAAEIAAVAWYRPGEPFAGTPAPAIASLTLP